MAHKGKPWKLWFRRDATWDQDNYNFGWPEAYRIAIWGDIFSARYAVNLLPDVLAINLNKEYIRTWTSAVVGGFFDNCYWKISFPGVPDENHTQGKFEIWHDAVIPTPLYSVTYRFSDLPVRYTVLRLGFPDIVHFISPDISVDPDHFHPTLQAARYDVYNPS